MAYIFTKNVDSNSNLVRHRVRLCILSHGRRNQYISSLQSPPWKTIYSVVFQFKCTHRRNRHRESKRRSSHSTLGGLVLTLCTWTRNCYHRMIIYLLIQETTHLNYKYNALHVLHCVRSLFQIELFISTRTSVV